MNELALNEGRTAMAKLVKRFGKRAAEKQLRRYLAEEGYRIYEIREWARWDNFPRPMWSAWAIIYKYTTFTTMLVGLHIYDDGEVLIAYRDTGEYDF